MRDIYQIVLRRLGFEVVSASTDWTSAIEYFSETDSQPELLITELSLNGFDGLTTAEEVSKRFEGTVVIVATSDVNAKELVESRGFHFLLKPFTVRTLARLIFSGEARPEARFR
jgi:DNA-binding NtrC family response regulator